MSSTCNGYNSDGSEDSIIQSPIKHGLARKLRNTLEDCTAETSIDNITQSPNNYRQSIGDHNNAKDTISQSSGQEISHTFEHSTSEVSIPSISKSPNKCLLSVGSLNREDFITEVSMGRINKSPNKHGRGNWNQLCQGDTTQGSMGYIIKSPSKSRDFTRNSTNSQEYTAQGSMGCITKSLSKSREPTRNVFNSQEYTAQGSMGYITKSPSKSREPTRNSTNSQEYTAQGSMGSITPSKSRGSTGNLTTSDDEMIEGLFYACDEKDEGWVKVSSLVEYLTANTNNSTGPETDDAINRLETLLNPVGLVGKIVDLETCRFAIRCWIKEVRNGQGNPSVEEILNSPRNSPRRSKLFTGNESLRTVSTEKIYTASPLVDSLDLSRMSLDYSILETSNRVQEQELSEMLSKIYDLQNQNRKLIEDNSKLQQHLDVQDENVTSISLDNKNLYKKVKCLQNIVEERNEILSENEELKVKLTSLHDAKKDLEDVIIKLEKEKTQLDIEVKNTENKMLQLTVEIEDYRQQGNSLTILLSEERETNIKLQEMKLLHETQILEKSEKLEKLESYIEELHQMNEDVRADKSGLQQELIQAQHHIFSLENGELNPEKEDLEEEDCSISIPPTPSTYCLSTSTPQASVSIHTQLYRTLGSSPLLPSPLCNKEIADSLRQLDNHSTSSLEEELSSILDSVQHDKNKPSIITETAKLLSRSKKKREEFLRDIDDLLNSPPELEKYKADNSSQDLLTKNIQIVEVLKVLKEENERLRSLHDESVESLLNLEKDKDTVYDNRIVILKDTLIDEQKQHQCTQSQLKTVEESLKEKIEEIETKQTELEYLETIKLQLEDQNQLLKRSNIDLSEKCHLSEIRTTELEEEMTEVKTSRDPHRLKYSDVERSSVGSGSTDCLKEQISKDIETLKSRLYKRQAALGALKGKQLALPLKTTDETEEEERDQNCYYVPDSPNSPLVDALTIDFFNGNYNKSAIKPASFSSFDGKSSRIHCNACYKNTLSNNTSCPALHTDSYAINTARSSQPNLTASSSSSTSGIDVSPRRTRSINGQIKRRSFIRHSSRFRTNSPGNNDQSNQSEESQRANSLGSSRLEPDSPSAFRRSSYTLAIESQTDLDNLEPLARDRSLSFQAAIEYGQRSPDSALELNPSMELSDNSDFQDYRGYDSYQGQGQKTEVKSVSFDIDDYEINNESNDNLLRSNPSPHRKLSILQEEEGENHSDQNGNLISISSSRSGDSKRHSTSNYLSESKESGMENLSTNIVRKNNRHPVQYDDKHKGPISVGVTREDWIAHMKTIDNKTEDTTFPPKLHSPPPLNNNSLDENDQESEINRTERDGHLVKQEEDTDHISTTPHIVTSRLSQIRQTNLAKKREQMKTTALPEVPEQKELKNQNGEMENGEGEDINPPLPTDEPVTPSIPDSFLQKLGLKVGKDPVSKESSYAENLSHKEIANKFNILSLAYRTDKYTLEKRLEIQERARDISEQNVDQELHGLREAVDLLNHLCSDGQIRDVIIKIKNHIDVLEQCAARVSSRAEVLGAVQQERRMCRAMEVMIAHVDNQKKLYEKDHTELEEARKILQDRPFGSAYGDSTSGVERRSMSVCAANGAPRLRRRSDVALPRVLGGRGCPPLLHSASLDHYIFEKKIDGSLTDSRLTKSDNIVNEEDEDEDPKQRFQSLVASASMKNAVTTVIRRASLEKQKSASATSLNTATPSTVNNNNTSLVKTDTLLDNKPKAVNTVTKEELKLPTKQTSQEEEAYQKGFEDGVKMKISKELGQLRDQQNGVSASLEQIMDKVEQTKHEEEVDIKSNEKVREAVMTKIRLFFPNKQELGQRLRVTLAGFIFLVALFIVVMTMMPSSAKAMELFTNVRHQSAPPR